MVRAFGTAMLVILDCGCTTALVTALLMARQRHTLGDSLMMLHRLPNFTELSAGFRMQVAFESRTRLDPDSMLTASCSLASTCKKMHFDVHHL